MIFQIPWKHAAKHGWDMEKDACLFRSWAIHTGVCSPSSHVNISSVSIFVLAYTSGVTCQRKQNKNFSGVKNYHCNENTQHSSHLFLTGRYKVGEKDPDPKTWKANFRCAMNSLPDIEEVKDKSINKGSSAVRVYRMLPPLTKDQKKGKPSA